MRKAKQNLPLDLEASFTYFLKKWLGGSSISEIWKKVLLPLFDIQEEGAWLFAEGRHHCFSFSVSNDTIARQRILEINDEGYSCTENENETLYSWKEGKIVSVIGSRSPINTKVYELDIIKLFLWRVVNDLRQKDLEIDTIHDDLTSVYNQHYLRHLIEMELDRGKRHGFVFSLAFIDLDNLKAVNEAYGHLVGTEVLREVSGLLRNLLRRGDVVARFGGDEFVLLLLHAHPQEAAVVARRILKGFSSHVFLHDRSLSIRISASIGISGFPEHGDTTDTLIQKADMAMYRVKLAGKNGIEIFQGEH